MEIRTKKNESNYPSATGELLDYCSYKNGKKHGFRVTIATGGGFEYFPRLRWYTEGRKLGVAFEDIYDAYGDGDITLPKESFQYSYEHRHKDIIPKGAERVALYFHPDPEARSLARKVWDQSDCSSFLDCVAYVDPWEGKDTFLTYMVVALGLSFPSLELLENLFYTRDEEIYLKSYSSSYPKHLWNPK